MNKKAYIRVICFITCIILFTVHFNVMTASAAPIEAADSARIIKELQDTEWSTKKAAGNGSEQNTVLVNSLKIVDLEEPRHGHLLDNTATVVTDNGFRWNIPVIWVNKDGDVVHVAIEINDIIRSYPIFVFYLPEGYSFIFSDENAEYNIEMPDFVVELMKKSGVATLAVPRAGYLYISTFLPNSNKIKINYPDQENNTDSEPVSTPDQTINSDTGNKIIDPDGAHPETNPIDSGPHLTPPTDNETSPPESGLSDLDNIEVAYNHSSTHAVDVIGVDNLAALIMWVKNTLEPEAVNLLVSKYPAYKTAASNGELGERIGFEIKYDIDDEAIAAVSSQTDTDGTLAYRVIINANYLYVETEDDSENPYVFDEKNYSELDNTLVHEMMHAFMDDYTRTGMTGLQYNETDGTYSINSDNSEGVEYPAWFVEGIASSVDNTFQYRNRTIYRKYGYDNDNQSETYDNFTAEVLKESYSDSSNKMRLGENSTEAEYITGYLASIYLGYLSAKAAGYGDAVIGERVDSSIILAGENYMLEQLHNGKTLDQLIQEVSNSEYNSTSDFAEKFITDSSGIEDTDSLQFCATLLNYLHNSSSDEGIANGSVLLDFADTNPAQLHKSLLDQEQTVYIMTDDDDNEYSTVDKNHALQGGGTSETGIISSDEQQPASDSTDETDPDALDSDKTAQAAKIPDEQGSVEVITEEIDDADVAAAGNEASSEESCDPVREDSNSSEEKESTTENEQELENIPEISTASDQEQEENSVIEAAQEDTSSTNVEIVADNEVLELTVEDLSGSESELDAVYISEQAPEEPSGTPESDNTTSEQVLDALSEPSSDEQDEPQEEAPTE